ncbi:hypothetical protein COC69_12730 [Bacillus cereus]|uniref:Uncharacterized protein n=1 Tax=Bacillus cereus TaxID=1396 RepID=A0A9X7CNV0_BACCE|nr:hypothetical protein [Bacillus cereus]PGS79159.1 hypothetical protein COC69_12730 [Bacillus cereus]
MKYKDRIQAKRNYKQAIFAAATTLTLGVSALAGPASAFAAENPQPLKVNQITPFKSALNFDDLEHWVLSSRLSNTTSAQISEVAPTGTKQISVDEFHLKNDSSQDRLMSIPEKTFTTSDGITTSKSQEFTTSTEISFESSKVSELIAKISGKFQFGTKTSTGENKTHSDTISLKYGGGTQMVPAGKTLIVQYLYEQQTYKGKLKFGATLDREPLEGVYKYDLYSSDDKYGGSLGYNTPEKTLYEIFNTAVNGKTISDNPVPVEALMLSFRNTDAYYLTKKDVQDHITLDADKKQASLKDDEGSFDGVTGTRIIQQIKDAQTGQVYSSEVVKTF